VNISFVSLVNLLAERAVVPELLQDDCNSSRLAAELKRLLREPKAAEAQRAGFAEILAKLRPAEGAPSEAAAAAVLEMLCPIPA
jgi:lipid-A-disaccharide synthase